MRSSIVLITWIVVMIACPVDHVASQQMRSIPAEPVRGWSHKAAFILGGRLKADLRKQRRRVHGRILAANHGYAYITLNDADVQNGDVIEAHRVERIYRERYGRPRWIGLMRVHAGTLLVVRADNEGSLCKLVEGQIIHPNDVRIGHFRDIPTMNVEIRAMQGSRRETAIARFLTYPLKQRFRVLRSFVVIDPDLHLPGSQRTDLKLATYEPDEGDVSRSTSPANAPKQFFVLCDVSEQGEIAVFRLRLLEPRGNRVLAEATLEVDPVTLEVLSPRTRKSRDQ